MTTERRLLAVLAHPDDESFGPGGVLAKAASSGTDVHLVTLTDGAAGTTDDGLSGADLAAVRADELQAATAELGVTLHHLSHRDSGFGADPAGSDPDALINQPQDALIAELNGLIQQLHPDVVLTHDETGGYGHRDHIRCHEVTVAAFHVAEPWKPQRLYVEVTSDRWMRVAAKTMRLLRKDPTRVGANKDIDLTKVGVPSSAITTRVDIRSSWPAKKAASSHHKSQGGGPPHTRHLPAALLKLLFPKETFMRIEPAPQPGLSEASLFEGLE